MINNNNTYSDISHLLHALHIHSSANGTPENNDQQAAIYGRRKIISKLFNNESSSSPTYNMADKWKKGNITQIYWLNWNHTVSLIYLRKRRLLPKTLNLHTAEQI